MAEDVLILHAADPSRGALRVLGKYHPQHREDPSPWLINIPPVPTEDPDDTASYLPSVLRPYPTASIHYRWGNLQDDDCPSLGSQGSTDDSTENDQPRRKLQWPTPLHDILFGYSHLIEEVLTSEANPLQRRNLFVYGSWLGGGLAAALALTESHVHQPVAVRGLLAVNGAYDWTSFLPDHPCSKLGPALQGNEEKQLHHMQALMPDLFASPRNLFDPFASPTLFFHTAMTPKTDSFTEHVLADASETTDTVDELASLTSSLDDDPYNAEYADRVIKSATSSQQQIIIGAASIRKAYYVFPPRDSGLKIPQTLLLHDSPPSPVYPPQSLQLPGKARKKMKPVLPNSFARQAEELAAVMRRSVAKVEIKERMKWDHDLQAWENEAEDRVEVRDIGHSGGGRGEFATDLGLQAEEVASEWLRDRMGY